MTGRVVTAVDYLREGDDFSGRVIVLVDGTRGNGVGVGGVEGVGIGSTGDDDSVLVVVWVIWNIIKEVIVYKCCDDAWRW